MDGSRLCAHALRCRCVRRLLPYFAKVFRAYSVGECAAWYTCQTNIRYRSLHTIHIHTYYTLRQSTAAQSSQGTKKGRRRLNRKYVQVKYVDVKCFLTLEIVRNLARFSIEWHLKLHFSTFRVPTQTVLTYCICVFGTKLFWRPSSDDIEYRSSVQNREKARGGWEHDSKILLRLYGWHKSRKRCKKVNRKFKGWGVVACNVWRWMAREPVKLCESFHTRPKHCSSRGTFGKNFQIENNKKMGTKNVGCIYCWLRVAINYYPIEWHRIKTDERMS